jgi:hypothetical protein
MLGIAASRYFSRCYLMVLYQLQKFFCVKSEERFTTKVWLNVRSDRKQFWSISSMIMVWQHDRHSNSAPSPPTGDRYVRDETNHPGSVCE